MDVQEQRVRFVVEATQKRSSFGALCEAYEIAPHRISVAAALPGTGSSRDRRMQPQAAPQSASHR
jgi:hypothetical protein